MSVAVLSSIASGIPDVAQVNCVRLALTGEIGAIVMLRSATNPGGHKSAQAAIR